MSSDRPPPTKHRSGRDRTSCSKFISIKKRLLNSDSPCDGERFSMILKKRRLRLPKPSPSCYKGKRILWFKPHLAHPKEAQR